MIIDCISDLHGCKPALHGGDLLIIAGDLTGRDTLRELDYFNEWVQQQDYKKKVLIAGNHDGLLERVVFDSTNPHNGTVFLDYSVDYLCDSSTEFEGLKIWGSPWTKTFYNWHFMMEPDKLAKHWESIPNDIDILITHGPAYGLLDKVKYSSKGNKDGFAGCPGLRKRIEEIKPKLFVCGHIHEGYGKLVLKHNGQNTLYVNASIMTENYDPINKPIRIEINEKVQRFVS